MFGRSCRDFQELVSHDGTSGTIRSPGRTYVGSEDAHKARGSRQFSSPLSADNGTIMIQRIRRAVSQRGNENRVTFGVRNSALRWPSIT